MLAAAHSESHGRDALPVCLGRENPNRLVSLWDLVNIFDLLEFARVHGQLEYIMASADASASSTASTGLVVRLCRDLVKFCEPHGFEASRDMAAIAASRLAQKTTVSPAVIGVEVRNLETQLSREIHERKFVWIAKDRTTFVDAENLFGEPVSKVFPSAAKDIKEAGNCLAIASSTAVVFHLMRVAEYGLRALAKKLRVSITHKGRTIPVQLADWDKVITGIKNKITEVRTSPSGMKRQEQLELYSDAGDHCSFMKDIWRNNVSHTRRSYTDKEAMAVLDRVQAFMMFLAQGLVRPPCSISADG
jgi:hypothetical protein